MDKIICKICNKYYKSCIFHSYSKIVLAMIDDNFDQLAEKILYIIGKKHFLLAWTTF
jgi:hypothetical protein